MTFPISKTRIFMQVFEQLNWETRNHVHIDDLVDEVAKQSNYEINRNDTQTILGLAIKNGHIQHCCGKYYYKD